MNLDLKIHHIGYAVLKLQNSLDVFLSLGYKKKSSVYRDFSRKIDIVFLEKDNLLVELLAPFQKDSPINNYLKKNGSIPYHICYSVKDIDNTIQKLMEKGFKLIEKAKPAIAFQEKKVSFLFHLHYGIIELLEE